MNDLQSQIQQVEVSLEEAERIAAFGEALNRLENNRDFQTVILEGYFQKEASRLVMLTGEINLKPEQKEAVYAGIRGIAELRQFFIARRTAGQMAAKEILDFKEALDEMREEA
ncbi:hypothetical protein [Dyella sp. ASV21]|uniref:hypothetical protein n=1 Tax=Dyella sp. ASV21 TaxID=2795114 RepID=UPI0018EC7ABC|nr:hypothetical protein [Dyella sp. ASV21]